MHHFVIITVLMITNLVSLKVGLVYNYVYQKEVSEYCRRRVVPSVFLGRDVVDAHSEMLHFSKMDLPYSCFISVRAESGSNVILVIQIQSEEDLFRSCAQSPDQLVVYEMGETFGGYWGAFSQSILWQDFTPNELYTLTKSTTNLDSVSTTHEAEVETYSTDSTEKHHSTPVPVTRDDFVVEIPIVNVSGHLEESYVRMPHPFVVEDNFDVLYDVTPRNGESYDVSIVPMAQFSVSHYKPAARSQLHVGQDLYDISYAKRFSQDPRLTHLYNPLKTTKPRNYPSRRYNNSRDRLTHKRAKIHAATAAAAVKRKHHNMRNQISKATINLITGDDYLSFVPNSVTKYGNNIENTTAWERIKELLKNLSKTEQESQSSETNKNISVLLDIMSNTNYNRSAYLYSNSDEVRRNFNKKYQQNYPDAHNLATFAKKPLSHFTESTRNDFSFLNPARNTYNLKSSIFDATTTNQLSSFVDLNNDIKDKVFTSNISEEIVRNYFIGKDNTTTRNSEKEIRSKTLVTKRMVHKSTTLSENELFDNNNDSLELKKISNQNTIETGNKVTEIMELKETNFRDEIITHSDIQKIDVQNLYEQKLSIESGPTLTVDTEKVREISDSHVSKSSQIYTSRSVFTASLVDHESWENVVQIAPVIAVHLNQTSPRNIKRNVTEKYIDGLKGNSSSVVRKKRRIKSIAISKARPHTMITKNTTFHTSTEVSSYGITDLQEFAQLIELQDDELHDRVSLRYLRQYLGPAMFNICDYREDTKIRQIFLFNSSRIVLAISNFTLEEMAVILTPAYTLFTGNSKCVESSLECQVFGIRVCIDYLNACDGVPNCGSDDIYDEDRIMCGMAAGLQQNVYLAAFTLLAVLLTALYAVHYWLRRCVPRVSEAFFVYTDRAENVLYLESIMRSPYDSDNVANKSTYNDNLLIADDILSPGKTDQNNICYRAFKRCVALITCTNKRKQNGTLDEQVTQPHRHTFSFAEHELRMMLEKNPVDASIQTGESLEMAYISSKRGKETTQRPKPYEMEPLISRYSQFDESDVERHVNELNLLKYLKDTKSDSSQLNSYETTKPFVELNEKLISNEETIIKTHTYAQQKRDDSLESESTDSYQKTKLPQGSILVECEVHSEKLGTSKRAKKHLRFEEGATTIPEEHEDSDEPSQSSSRKHKDHLYRAKDQDTIVEGETNVNIPSRDFKRFWTIKGKKSKKKSQVMLK